MSTLSNASQAFVDGYTTSDTDAPWLSSLKKCAIDKFSKGGLPTVRDEKWKYTNLNYLERSEWTEPPNDCEPGPLAWLTKEDALRLVFVNGHFNRKFSTVCDLPGGAFIGSLTEALTSQSATLEAHLGKISTSLDGPLLALNSAHMADGYVILLNNIKLAKTVEIIHVGRPDGQAVAYHPRNLVVLDHMSQATILEQFTGAHAGAYFANSALEIFVDGGSRLQHHRFFADGPEAVGVASTGVNVGRDASYTSLVLSDGGKLLRNDLRIQLAAAGAETKLGGIYLADGSQHVDHTTLIEHKEPHTTSYQVFKGALSGNARGVFQGNIIVHEGADGSDGQLNNRTLLLSPGTEVNSKPQLEIYADDVKCAHGSTVGDLDEEALFYLRSRGIPVNRSKAMLVEGFLSEVIDEFDLGELTKTFRGRISDWMGAA